MAIELKNTNQEQVKENFEQIGLNQTEIELLKETSANGYSKTEIDEQQQLQNNEITFQASRITENTREIESNTSSIKALEDATTTEPVVINKAFVPTATDWDGNDIRAGAWVDLGDLIQQPVGSELVIRLDDGNGVKAYINGIVGFSVDTKFFSQQNAQLRIENMSEVLDDGSTRLFIGVYIWENSTEISLVLDTIAKSGINQEDTNKLNKNFDNVLTDGDTPQNIPINVTSSRGITNTNNGAVDRHWIGTETEFNDLPQTFDDIIYFIKEDA